MRGLAFVYLLAFGSLWLQLDGLLGPAGILPADAYLRFVKEQLGGEAAWRVPTILWWLDVDVGLGLLCGGGVAIALVAFVGPYWTPPWVLLWAGYLSLTSVGQAFLSFQWDALLLETGFLAVFVAPCGIVPRWRSGFRSDCGPPTAMLWCVRWLLFRLMFASGVVKLSSDDPVWWDLSALEYHFFTQPLPPWSAWFAHQLPSGLLSTATGVMFFIELVVPFFIFGPRLLRLSAFWLLVMLQVVILITGNYGFFNYLTIVLCFVLLEDRSWPARWRRGRGPSDRESVQSVDADLPRDAATVPMQSRRSRSRWVLRLAGGTLAAALFVLSLIPFARMFRRPISWPEPLAQVYRAVQPFRLVNGYGLFADMTTTRWEIDVQGSDDGELWKSYEFSYKPGATDGRPAFVAPHQPRLDWQMWFAALGTARQNPWFVQFLRALLEGRAEVLDLLPENPFPERPPRYIRALAYEYRFTDWEEWRETGSWWRRGAERVYFRPASLR